MAPIQCHCQVPATAAGSPLPADLCSPVPRCSPARLCQEGSLGAGCCETTSKPATLPALEALHSTCPVSGSSMAATAKVQATAGLHCIAAEHLQRQPRPSL